MESVHGHEVLKMMLEAKTPWTTAALVSAVKARFGENTQYHTCSEQGLDAEALVAFLAQKGKFIDDGQGFTTSQDKICNH
ncbi:YecH family metal-binding protein [Mangrovibacter yixingensis]|uniref:YecH family metal-binding protein n=1 Tax=Mangrovibacter yixingensis TaxID=1529639 RepID=UPI001CFB7F9B|nr:YecH family metal-binding protein [Mangrovibacter yixingensis]